MPAAGDEGYEQYVICPYDPAHEIRKGRMQFHIKKCRENFPNSPLVECPYNKMHLIKEQELKFHMEEECPSRSNWDRYQHALETKVPCPVQDLVPVNAATVSDGGENWDTFEAPGSVLSHIKAQAEEKPIFRMLQVASKASRKKFRNQERDRHRQLAEQTTSKQSEKAMSDTSSVHSYATTGSTNPLPKPKIQPVVALKKGDPNQAMAIISRKFKSIDIDAKPSAAYAPSEASSAYAPSEASLAYAPSEASSVVSISRTYAFEKASTSRNTSTLINRSQDEEEQKASISQQMPFSYAAASRQGVGRGRGSLLGQQGSSRPGSAMSNGSTGTFGTALASASRPAYSVASRPDSAMSNASTSSFATANRIFIPSDDGFCQIPIPGIGRGGRKPTQ